MLGQRNDTERQTSAESDLDRFQAQVVLSDYNMGTVIQLLDYRKTTVLPLNDPYHVRQ